MSVVSSTDKPLPPCLLAQRKCFRDCLYELKERKLSKTDFNGTLTLINEWFAQTKFDGVIYEEKVEAPPPAPPGAAEMEPATSMPSLDLPQPVDEPMADQTSTPQHGSGTAANETDPPPPGYSAMILVSPSRPDNLNTPVREADPDQTIALASGVDYTEHLNEKNLALVPTRTSLIKSDARIKSDFETLLQTVQRRLSGIQQADKLSLHITAEKMLIASELTGQRTLLFGGKALLDVSEPWKDHWDRHCVAVALSNSGLEIRLIVVDAARALVLGDWGCELSHAVRRARVCWATNGSVALLVGSSGSEVQIIALSDDECSTSMTLKLTFPVPDNVSTRKLRSWRVTCRREGAIACSIEDEDFTHLGDIHTRARSLWVSHPGSLACITSANRDVANLGIEEVGSILSYLIAIDQKSEFFDLLEAWLQASQLSTAIGFLRCDILASWQLEVAEHGNRSNPRDSVISELPSEHGQVDMASSPTRRLKRFTVSRWRTDLLETWATSIPLIICNSILPILLEKECVADRMAVPLIQDFMMAVEKNDSEKFNIKCSELIKIQPGSIVLDVIVESCLQAGTLYMLG